MLVKNGSSPIPSIWPFLSETSLIMVVKDLKLSLSGITDPLKSSKDRLFRRVVTRLGALITYTIASGVGKRMRGGYG